MALLKQLRGFFRAFKKNDGPLPVKHVGHSIAKTAKHASHIASGGRSGNAAIGRGQDRLNKVISEGHENYNKSLEADD